jgi:hypothetical protein
VLPAREAGGQRQFVFGTHHGSTRAFMSAPPVQLALSRRLGRRFGARFLAEQQAVDAFAAAWNSRCRAGRPNWWLLISARTRPGCGDSSRMRLPTTSASSIEWVTNSMVKPTSSHSACSSSCMRAARERVERGEGFVHQQDVRLHGQRARDRHPRLHAAGQRVREGVGKARQPDLAQPVQRALSASLRFMPPASIGNITFCFTVFQGGSWSNSWNTTMRSGPGPTMRLPPAAGCRRAAR